MDRVSPEQSERDSRRGYSVYMLTVCVILLCAQGILFVLMLENTVGRISFWKKRAATDPVLLRDFRAVILKSELSAQLSPENPESYYMRERYWEAILSDAGIPYTVVTDAQVAGALNNANVLILPGVACMGPTQREVVSRLLSNGKGIVASGPMGTRDAKCTWSGWDFLANSVGASTMATTTPQETTYVALRGQQPFSRAVPAGFVVPIPSQEIAVAATPNADALLTDWRLRPSPIPGIPHGGVALHHSYLGGRVVWFGFSELLTSARPEVQQIFDSFAMDAVRWAGRQPAAYLAPWPGDRQSAAIVAETVHAKYADAERTAALFAEKKVPATFFVSSTEAAQHPSALKAFENAGEVASASDRYEALDGSVHDQGRRLVNAKQSLDKATGEPVVGFAAPYGTIDTATVMALHDAGYHYYLNEVAVSRAVPELVEFPSKSRAFPFQKTHVAKIFRTASDDFELMANCRGSDAVCPDLGKQFISEFRNVSYLGGVYTLYFHDYLLGAPQYRSTLSTVLDTFRSESVWIASARDIVNWWSARQNVQVSIKRLGPHRLQLALANLGNATLKDTSVYVYLPYAAKNIEIRSTFFRLQPPRFELVRRDDLMRINFGDLKAQENYEYIISLDE